MPADPTVSDIESLGYTHVRCWCEACRTTVDVPFFMIRRRQPWRDFGVVRFSKLQAMLRCERCPGRPHPTTISPTRQSDAPGYTKRAERPLTPSGV